VVRHCGETLLVHPESEQEVRYAVGRGQLAVHGLHAEAVHPAATGRHEQRTALTEQPDAELPALKGEAGLALELPLLVAE